MKVLLHICCGPCSIYPALKLKGLKIKFDSIFYNPNINNLKENYKRYFNAKKVSKRFKFKLINNLYQKNLENFFDYKGCDNCYKMRLDEVFSYAKNHNYTHITTSLLGSPYQKTNLILDNMKTLSEKYNVDILNLNFKEGFYYGQGLARKNDIYCQKFCGCNFSYENYLKNILKEENNA